MRLTTGRSRSLFADKGVMFLINHVVLAPLAVWLVLQLIMLEGVNNKRNLVVRFLKLGSVAVFGYLSLVLGRRGNARLLPCFVAAGLADELLMRASGSYGIAVFTDLIHVTDAANQLIARRIANELRVWDALRPERQPGAG